METITKKDFKKDFTSWYIDLMSASIISKCMKLVLPYQFYDLPESMKWGVYVDFFDSVGIGIAVIPHYNNENILRSWYYDVGNIRWLYYEKTIQESREKALEKAIEIYEKE